MNKVLIFTLFFILNFTSCKTQIKTPITNGTVSENVIVYWRKDNVKNQSINMYLISLAKRNYKLLKGRLYNIESKEVVSNVKLVFITGDSKGEDVKISKGLPIGGYCDFTNGDTCKKNIHYDDNGNVDGYYSVSDYNTNFIEGNGFWKDYYSIYGKYVLKEEGEVKNNFKIGEWKYYDKNGKFTKTKIYSLKDSVDVRFPHCIFNKNEPCY